MIVLTAQQMREADTAAGKTIGQRALMKNAGARIAEIAARYARAPKAVAFAGPGNNGGDAFAALAELPHNFERIVFAEPTQKISEARLDAEGRARSAGVAVHAMPQPEDLDEAIGGAGIILDGIFGVGSRLPVAPEYEPVIAAMNRARAPVLAIDLPTGIDADRGHAIGSAVRATVTVTLGTLKLGLLLEDARAYAGDLWLADIAMSAQSLAFDSGYAALNAAEFRAMLPERAFESDKRSAGAPLIIAGSQQFPGAAVLCAFGAARAGAGYVTVAAPENAAAALRAHLLEQVVVTFDSKNVDESVETLLDTSKRCSSIGIGPGLALEDRTGEIVREFVRQCELPIVADASALFHFAKHLDGLRGKAIVLTPHEKEFARLSGKGTLEPGARIDRLREFVDRTGVTTLLKGPSTLVYDGKTVHVNTTGTPALATAGTGDVLTGMIATLLSQGLSPVDSARAAAYWHGLAAQCAASVRPRGVIARDVYEMLGASLPQPQPHENLLRIF